MQSSRLENQYLNITKQEMMETFKYKNIYAVPKITKVVLSMGLGKRDMDKNMDHLTKIAGQKCVPCKARKSIAAFNVREGKLTGAKVTLRRSLMYYFLDKTFNAYLVNNKSYEGESIKSINNTKKNLCLSIGIEDKRLFHEVNDNDIRSEGLNISICTNCVTKKEVAFLLNKLGLPFKENINGI